MTGTFTATLEGLTHGTIEFSTNTTDGVLRDPAGNVLWIGPKTVRIVNGEVSVQLPATDDTAYAETGWQWRAKVTVDGKSSSFLRWFELPDGTTKDLADIAGELRPGDPLTHPAAYADVVADIQDPESVIGQALSASIDATAVNRTDTADDEVGAFDGFLIRSEVGPRDAKWTETIGHHRLTEGATTLTNSVKNWAYNAATNSTPLDVTEPMVRMAIESSYINDDAGGPVEVWSEYHVGYVNAGETEEVRAISIAWVHDGDGGLGSPRVSFKISEDESPAFLIWNVQDVKLFEYGAGRFHSHRNVLVVGEDAAGASTPSWVTIGDGTNDATLTLRAGDAYSASIDIKDATDTRIWSLSTFTDDETPSFSFYDDVHNRMHVQFIAGANSGSAVTVFNSLIESTFAGGGLILSSPNAARWFVQVSNAGVLSAVAV